MTNIFQKTLDGLIDLEVDELIVHGDVDIEGNLNVSGTATVDQLDLGVGPDGYSNIRSADTALGLDLEAPATKRIRLIIDTDPIVTVDDTTVDVYRPLVLHEGIVIDGGSTIVGNLEVDGHIHATNYIRSDVEISAGDTAADNYSAITPANTTIRSELVNIGTEDTATINIGNPTSTTFMDGSTVQVGDGTNTVNTYLVGNTTSVQGDDKVIIQSLDPATGEIILESAGTLSGTISLNTQGATNNINLSATGGASGIELTTTGATGGIVLNNIGAAGGISLNQTGAAGSIALTNEAAGGTISLNTAAGSGNITLTTEGADSNIILSPSGAQADIVLAAQGAANSNVLISSVGTTSNVQISASGGEGSILLNTIGGEGAIITTASGGDGRIQSFATGANGVISLQGTGLNAEIDIKTTGAEGQVNLEAAGLNSNLNLYATGLNANAFLVAQGLAGNVYIKSNGINSTVNIEAVNIDHVASNSNFMLTEGDNATAIIFGATGNIYSTSTADATDATGTADASSFSTKGGISAVKSIYSGSGVHVNYGGTVTNRQLKISPSSNNNPATIGFYTGVLEGNNNWELGINANSAGANTFALYSSTLGQTVAAFSPSGGASFRGPLNVLESTGSGIVQIFTPSGASYNFNLPTTAGTAGQVLTSQGGGATAMTWTTPATGTVTSVGLAAPSIFTVTGSPVTTSGTLTLSYSGTPLPVANGGTGVTTSTGTTNVVLSDSPTLTGTLTAGRIVASTAFAQSPTALCYSFTNTTAGAGIYLSGFTLPNATANSDIRIGTGTALSSLNYAFLGHHVRAAGNYGSLSLYGSVTGIQFRADGTASTSTTTGNLTIPGGLGLTGAINAGSTISTTSTVSSQGLLVNGPTSGTVSILPQAAAGTYNFNLPTTAGTVGQVLTSQGGGATAMTWTTAATGTVTSVALAAPSIFTVTGSPVTTSGTLTLSYSGTPLPVANGGTGTTTSTGTGAVVLNNSPTFINNISISGTTSGTVTLQTQAAAGTYNFNLPTTAGTAGQVLTSQGGASNVMTWTTPAAPGTGTVTSVALAAPSIFTVTGSPVTTSGTLTLSYSGTALPVANGGTGTTTSTGTGSVVLSASPTLTGTLTTGGITASVNNAPSATVPDYSFTNTNATLGAHIFATLSPNAPNGSDLYYAVGKSFANLQTAFFSFHPNASGNYGALSLYGSGTRIKFFADGTASTSTTTGQLTVPGGVGITGAFNAGGNIAGPAVLLNGSTSGTVSILPQAVAGTYNFNLPTTAGTSGQVLTSAGGAGAAMTWTTPGSGGVGTVTSVALAAPSIFTVTGSPVTTSGTLTLSYSGTPLPVANGGTGTTTSTGTGSVVLSASPTLTGNLTTQQITASFNTAPSAGSSNYTFTNTNNTAGAFLSGYFVPNALDTSDIRWGTGLGLANLNCAFLGHHVRAAGNYGSLSLYGSATGIQFRADGTASTSTTTGNLTIPGGTGMTGNLWVGGTINTTNSTNSTSTTTGSITSNGGLGVQGNIFSGGSLNGTQLATSGNFGSNAGAFTAASITNTNAAAGIYLSGYLAPNALNNADIRWGVGTAISSLNTAFLGFHPRAAGNYGSLSLYGSVTGIQFRADGTASTSVTTGNLTVPGGLGVNGNINALGITGTSLSTGGASFTYSEGTYTPTVSSAGYTASGYSGEGRWVKVGRTCTLSYDFTVTLNAVASAGPLIMTLPFNAAWAAQANVCSTNLTVSTPTSWSGTPTWYIQTNFASADAYFYGSNGNLAIGPFMSGTARITGVLTYVTQ